MDVVSNVCDEPTAFKFLVQPIGAHGGEFMYFGSFCFRDELGFLNCDDISMATKQKRPSKMHFFSSKIYQ